jgi:hypothetical protein
MKDQVIKCGICGHKQKGGSKGFRFHACNTENSLVGKWFHSFHREGKSQGHVLWQGQVLSAQPNDHFLVQLYEWLLGEPNKQVIVPFSEMVDWQFYPSAEQMMHVYEHQMADQTRPGTK